MMKVFVFITLILSHFILLPAFAKGVPLDIQPEKEIEILESLDIDPLFFNNEHYVKIKENINQLKKIFFLRTLKRGSLFMPNLQELLNESNIPNTFLYMAMVESKFLADSKSHKHAAGLWQFMPATAKVYKLKKDREVDERLDPIKSTKAAIEYLKYLHDRFHKWYLAAMAYNCGGRRLNQAIKRAGTDDLAVLLDEEKAYLPKETRDYIQRIIVAALLAHDKNILKKNNNNHLYGFCSNKKLTKLYFKGGESLESIAVKIGVPYKKLKACNPHLIKNKLPSNTKMYYVYLPEDLAKKAQERIKESGKTFVYYVQPNDTLYRISRRFNIRLRALCQLNPQLEKKHILKIGMPLTLIGKIPADLPKSALLPKEKEIQKVITYTTKADTSLYKLSLQFNNKLSALKRLNPNLQEPIKKGTQIKVIVTEQPTVKQEQNTTIALFKTKPVMKDSNHSLTDHNNTNSSHITINTDNKEINITKIDRSTKILQKNLKQKPTTHEQLTYTLKEGDTLETIAKYFHIKVNDLFKPGNILSMKLQQQNSHHNYSETNQTHTTGK